MRKFTTMILFAAMFIGCSTAPREVDFNMKSDFDFGVSAQLANTNGPAYPEEDIHVILENMDTIPISKWAKMSNPPRPYIDALLPKQLHIKAMRRGWKLEITGTCPKTILIEKGQIRMIPMGKELRLQWPDETLLYSPLESASWFEPPPWRRSAPNPETCDE